MSSQCKCQDSFIWIKLTSPTENAESLRIVVSRTWPRVCFNVAQFLTLLFFHKGTAGIDTR